MRVVLGCRGGGAGREQKPETLPQAQIPGRRETKANFALTGNTVSRINIAHLDAPSVWET